MRLLFSLFSTLMLGACLVTSLGAQERAVKQPRPAALGVINDLDVIVTDLTEEKLNNPPKREIKFERLAEPLKRKLTKPDPKLLELKYVATFQLSIPPSGKNYGTFPRDKDGRVPQSAFLGEFLLINPQNGGGTSTSDSFLRMINALPTADSPSKQEREFFSNPKTVEEMLVLTTSDDFSNRPGSATWNITILGTTPELIELRTTALPLLLDQGICRPIQLAIFKKREPLCVQLRDKRKAVAEVQQSANTLQEELKSYADFTPDMLPNLRVQQLQLEIDLAGVMARIAACSRLLAQPALKADRRNQIEDLKVSAEIEFSGFEARRTKSEEFIGKVKTKVDLLGKLSKAEFSQSAALSGTRGLEEQIKNVDAAIRAYAPLPLVDNKVVVQPLEWTQ